MTARRLLMVLAVFVMLCLAFSSHVFASDSLNWPVKGGVLRQFSAGEHRGVDISANVGDPVAAAQDGVIYWVGKTPTGEPCISIDHPGGLTSTYLPVKASVQKGQAVKAGEAIGTISSETDKSSGVPHLHFGIFDTASRDGKNYLNPCDFLVSQGVRTEDKCPQEVEKPVQAVVPADIPKNSPGEVVAAKPSGEPKPSNGTGAPSPVEAATPSRVEAIVPGSPPVKNQGVATANPKITTFTGPPLKDRSRETNLNRLVLVTENTLVVGLDKGGHTGAVKPPWYLQVVLLRSKLLSEIGFAFLVLVMLMLIAGRVLSTFRVPAIIDRSYTPASA